MFPRSIILLLQGSLLFLSLFLNAVADPCPQYVQCATSETPEKCPQGTFYRDNVKVFNCCPGCVEGLKDYNETCANNQDCQPGLMCSVDFLCDYDKTNQPCEKYKRDNPNRKYYTATCLQDGYFAPVQCKGEELAGKCFCVDKMGTRIYGEENWSKAGNMTCSCSRQISEMQRTDVSLHCTSQGNFEPLQCDDGLCWCADDKTGLPYTMIVPQSMDITLPCYNMDTLGTQYLRRCDSMKVNQDKTKKLLEVHGTSNIFFTPVSCNYDGSYGRVQNIDNKWTCTDSGKIPIDGVQQTDANKPKPDCNCAYDKYLAGSSFYLQCDMDGTYLAQQRSASGDLYCVDSDGMAATEIGVAKC